MCQASGKGGAEGHGDGRRDQGLEARPRRWLHSSLRCCRGGGCNAPRVLLRVCCVRHVLELRRLGPCCGGVRQTQAIGASSKTYTRGRRPGGRAGASPVPHYLRIALLGVRVVRVCCVYRCSRSLFFFLFGAASLPRSPHHRPFCARSLSSLRPAPFTFHLSPPWGAPALEVERSRRPSSSVCAPLPPTHTNP